MKTLCSFETTLRMVGSHAHLGGDRCPSLRIGAWSGREFGPPAWFPEGMVAGALQTDLLHAFLHLAHAAGLKVVSYQSSALSQLGSCDGGPQLTAVVLRPWATVEGGDPEVALAVQLLDRALEASRIARLLRITPQLQVLVDAVRPPPVESPLEVR